MSDTPVADLLGQADFDAPPSECDMVMKGGITSGVIYPLAVCQLAHRHRLRNIGGASAGAIAAGAAAIAEYARADQGYRRLAEIPDKVGRDLDRLFQPTADTRPAMRVLLAALAPEGKLRGSFWALLRWRLLWFLFGLVVVAGLFLAGIWAFNEYSWPAWSPLWRGLAIPLVFLAIPAGVVTAAAGLVLLVLKEAPLNYFGLANGMTTEPDRGPALTPWMHAEFQYLGGRSVDAEPLTFGDLWGDEAVAAWPSDVTAGQRRINLQVMTTNLTEGMPYRVPFVGNRFAFCMRCFRDLFPEPVVNHMIAASAEVERGDDGTAACHRHDEPVQLRYIPDAPDFPILVAVRMSLSFPVLISAVPLYKRDFNRKAGRQDWTCNWFSDGGIGSNFPIHFFDSPWPMRPTFGIDLQPTHPDFPESEFYRRQQGRRAQPRTMPMPNLVSFLSRILHTMQNWRDDSLARSPGYSDRIVTIFQKGDEGGMNLRMPGDVITKLAARGGRAAREFDDFDLDYHRWERYRIAMAELDVLLSGLYERYGTAEAGVSGYRDFIATHRTSSYVPRDSWLAQDREHTKLLMDLTSSWIDDGNSAREQAPSPSPVFRFDSRQVDSD
jgi:predicted acylesterase/phospholipase RssA